VDDLKKIARYINTKFGKQFTYSVRASSALLLSPTNSARYSVRVADQSPPRRRKCTSRSLRSGLGRSSSCRATEGQKSPIPSPIHNEIRSSRFCANRRDFALSSPSPGTTDAPIARGELTSHHGGRASSSTHQQYATSASSSPYSSQHSNTHIMEHSKGPLVVRLPNHHAPGAQLPAYMKDMKYMQKNGELPSSATGQQGGSSSKLQARNTSAGSFSSRRVHVSKIPLRLSLLHHPTVCLSVLLSYFLLFFSSPSDDFFHPALTKS
jgi:hypothetical protein